MKKLWLLLPLIFLAVSCSKPEQDPFKAYRKYSSTALFTSGEKALAKGNYDDAVKYLEALDGIYPFGPYAEQAQLDIIYAYHLNNDDASAAAAAERYIRLYPRGDHVDYAYYMRGMIGFSEGLSWIQRVSDTDPAPRDLSNLRQSYVAFASLVHYFPNSIYTPNAKLRMVYIRNLVARRELMVAEAYMQRDAYVAAANRADYVVKHFEGAPQVVPALAIMVKAYRKLGLTNLANQTYELLAANYPNSPEAQQLKN